MVGSLHLFFLRFRLGISFASVVILLSGMLRGDGNEDLGATEIGCGTAHPDGNMGDCQTELPYISITCELLQYDGAPVD